MQQHLSLTISLSGDGRSFKLCNAYLKTHSWPLSLFYKPVLIVVGEVSLDDVSGRGLTQMIHFTPSAELIVETGYERELATRFYIINDTGFPLCPASKKESFIEVAAFEEIDSLPQDLQPLKKIPSASSLLSALPSLSKGPIPPPRKLTEGSSAFILHQLGNKEDFQRLNDSASNLERTSSEFSHNPTLAGGGNIFSEDEEGLDERGTFSAQALLLP